MPTPLWIGRLNKHTINVVAKLIAPRTPGFALVIHRGRTSGRTYRTPVIVFRRGQQFVIHLTYGPNTDWVRNVRAAGGCEIITRGRRYQLGNPHLDRDETASGAPALVRFILRRVVKADEFLTLDVAQQPASATTRRTAH